MNSFLNPYNKQYGKVNNSIINLQLKDIIRMMYPDVANQNRIIEFFSNICTDRDIW